MEMLFKPQDSKHTNKYTQFTDIEVALFLFPLLCRVLMVSPEQEESVDLLEQREKLAPLALLDLLDSLDLLLVPLYLGTYRLLIRLR